MEESEASASSSARVRRTLAEVGTRLGRYELIEELGEGGMATVFLARDTELRRDVALKVMFPHLAKRAEGAARFKREARAAAALDHPNILRVLDVGGGEQVGDELEPPYIVLELIDGMALDQQLKESGPPCAEVVAAIGVALCRALELAHDRGVIHRDIKPANVMMTGEGRLVLADFGVARVSEEDSVLTRTGAVLGTPAFMSPEQASGESVDERSDLYSLGATLYTLATGSLPYAGNTATIVASLLEGSRPAAEERRPQVGRELSRIIERCMSLDPGARPKSARELRDELESFVAEADIGPVDELLELYCSDPAGSSKALRPKIVLACLRRARTYAEEGRGPLGLSLANRALAIDPKNAHALALVDRLGQPKTRKMWLAIVAPMVVTAGVGLFFWNQRPGPISTYADAAPADAFVPPADPADADLPDAASAEPLDDSLDAGLDAGVSPAKERPTRRPSRSVDASVVLPVATPDAAPLPVEAVATPPKPARVVVDIKPWCDISIDGHSQGRASATREIELEPGKHLIRCSQSATGKSWEKTVELSAGERRHLEGRVLGSVRVRVSLEEGDEVRIGERRVPTGRPVELPADRYRVEVFSKGKSSGSPRYLDLRRDCTLVDRPSLSCTP